MKNGSDQAQQQRSRAKQKSVYSTITKTVGVCSLLCFNLRPPRIERSPGLRCYPSKRRKRKNFPFNHLIRRVVDCVDVDTFPFHSDILYDPLIYLERIITTIIVCTETFFFKRKNKYDRHRELVVGCCLAVSCRISNGETTAALTQIYKMRQSLKGRRQQFRNADFYFIFYPNCALCAALNKKKGFFSCSAAGVCVCF